MLSKEAKHFRTKLFSASVAALAILTFNLDACIASHTAAFAATASPPAVSSAEVAASAELAKLATQRFGALSAAESKLIAASTQRETRWLGPTEDTDSPLNDPSHGGDWGPERTLRASLVRWLVSDPSAAPLMHPSGPGLAGARIDGRLDLSYATIDKPIFMLRCFVPDGIDLTSAHLQSLEIRRSRTGPISGDNSIVHGDLFFDFGDYQSLSLFRARIEGSLELRGSHVMGAGQTTVNVVESTIDGDAIFQGFTTDGTVDVRLAKIGNALDFHAAQFSGEGGLNAERAIVRGTLYWTDVKHTPQTMLDLEDVRAGGIWDDEASWPAPGKLDINGFVYDEIVGGPDDAPQRLRWLALQPPGWSPQPYRQLAKVLAETGRENGATDVRIAKEIAQRRLGHMTRLERAWSLMLQLTIGFGYRPLRALWWIGAFVALGTLLFGLGYRLRLVTPTEEAAYARFVTTGHAPPHYPLFNPFIYSLENFLPVVVLYQDQYWRPNARHSVRGKVRGADERIDADAIPSRLLRWYLWVHILAGWIITPLLFAGLSGLVRPD